MARGNNCGVFLFLGALFLIFSSFVVAEEGEQKNAAEPNPKAEAAQAKQEEESESEDEEGEEGESEEEDSLNLSEMSRTSALHKLVEIEDVPNFPARELLLYIIFRYEEEVTEEPPLPAKNTAYDALKFNELYPEAIESIKVASLLSNEEQDALQSGLSYLPVALSYHSAFTFSKKPASLFLQTYIKQEYEAKYVSGEVSHPLVESVVVGEKWEKVRAFAKQWRTTSNPLYALVAGVNLQFELPVAVNATNSITTSETPQHHPLPVPVSFSIVLRHYLSFFLNKEELTLWASESSYDHDTSTLIVQTLLSKILPRPYPEQTLKALTNMVSMSYERIGLTEITVSTNPEDNKLKLSYEIGDGLVTPQNEATLVQEFVTLIGYPGDSANFGEAFLDLRTHSAFVMITLTLEDDKLLKEVEFDCYVAEYLSNATTTKHQQQWEKRWTEFGKHLTFKGLEADNLAQPIKWAQKGTTYNKNLARYKVHYDGEKIVSGAPFFNVDLN
eukprot:TRINITY_DN6261_c0_g1_i1.p1 TRINITY_DN6261_c0_g1~~TRINITY_DN6261_c0_g1_i1.p1  ORF type:complete len:501 (-),score=163.91 TRINITY_DN6261_c0_g1_i1:104-1606(-)